MPRTGLGAALRSAFVRAPCVVPPEASVSDLLRELGRRGADVAVVADPASHVPLGVVALHDLLGPLADGQLDLAAPVAGVMTGGVPSLAADATVQQAAVLMTRRGLRYLLLTEADGRLFSLVEAGELYGLRAAGSEMVVAGVLAARTIAELAGAAAEVSRFAARRLAEGVGPEALCQWMSALNDLVTVQAIDLVEGGFDLPIVPWCWLAFGSEGRLEQTLVTDQDNGIVFEPEDAADTERLREAFRPFAVAVNHALAACGFPLCKGEIMAGNPKWCLSLDEWKQSFGRWMAVTEPQALLNATIFFDFRPLYGRDELALALRDWLLARVPGKPAFLHAMAEQALDAEPPLGFLGGFRLDAGAEFPDTLDLKAQAIRFFVDAARILALSRGIAPTNTVERLRLSGAALGTPEEETATLVEAFYQIQRLRLDNQLAPVYPQAANRLNPARLNALNRQILKEALKHARRLQQRVGLDYGV
jgi:CBS domain-containing protein